MNREDLLAFWGKTVVRTGEPLEQTDAPSAGYPAYKPVLHHLLDVAAVALRWQHWNVASQKREAVLLGVGPEELAPALAFLAGIHDIGKFSRSFQALDPRFWPTRVLGPMRTEGNTKHWRNTAILLRTEPIASELEKLFPGTDRDLLGQLIAAVSGHHGQPPKIEEVNADSRSGQRSHQIGSVCVSAAHEAVLLLRQVIQPLPLKSLERHRSVARWSWMLSGFVTISDWVGSDDLTFRFEPSNIPIEEYWKIALSRADKALALKGLVPKVPVTRPSFATIAPQASGRLRPMQELAQEVALTTSAQLVIVEDTTGSGKTEAAVMLATRMMSAGKGEGIYFALPTMATANAMHGRLADTYRSFFVDSASPSLVLAHGRSNVSKFLSENRTGNSMASGSNDETASAYCTDWISDDRRKAFLADVGAGTIDQAFLAVLPKRFLTLRQFALARRILVIDEAHCFDSYMREELKELVRLHAQNGGSTIVLSATLTVSQRRELAEAFGTGIGLRNPEVLGEQLKSAGYPLLTSVSDGRVHEHEPGFDESLRREIAIERVPERRSAIATAIEAAEHGASVAVICNAVDEAIGAYEEISGRLADRTRIQLFHARFAQCDRQGIEDEVLRRFGRPSKVEDRAGRILVATQVVEQSLDLDFDFLVSDLCPIDLLIQRAGRLWRHMDLRPAHRRPIKGPRMVVLSPSPDDVSDAEWLKPALGNASYVYRNPAVMWRTAHALFNAGRITTPDSFRSLIEYVYAEDELPDVLRSQQIEAEGRLSGESALGRFNVVNLEDGYLALESELSPNEDIGTRLGEKTVTLRLAREREGRLIPWSLAPVDDPRIAWVVSEVRVRETLIQGTDPLDSDLRLHEEAKRDWPKWQRGMQIAIVQDDTGVRLGGRVRWTYCKTMGLKPCSPVTRE